MLHKSLFAVFLTQFIVLSTSCFALEKNSSAIVFSKSYKGLNVDKAYQLQKAFVRNQASYGNAMIGFKAELNAKAKQEEYGLSAPISGILMRSARIDETKALSFDKTAANMIKIGLSFKTSKAIRKPVESVTQLKSYFSAAALTLEIPNFSFDSAQFNGLDVIANNAMANKVLFAQWQAIPEHLDALSYQLSCDGKRILTSNGSEIGDGQWQTLLWLVNHVIDQGYTIRAEQFLFTGGLGDMLPLQACHYHASISSLGDLWLQVR